MKRTVFVLLSSVCALVLAVPTAHAESESAAEFTGFYIMSSSLPPAFGNATETWQFTTKGCTEAAAHAKKSKPAATSGPCTIKAAGVVTGNCSAASGFGQGFYVDSLGQMLQFALTLTVVGPAWTWTGTITKGLQSGQFVATGTWQPSGPPCNPIGSLGAFDYTLT